MAGSTSEPVNTLNSSSLETGPTSHTPFVTVTFLFFFWGFLTVMNDVLIPFFKKTFDLTYFQAGLVQFAFFGAFFVISLLYFFISTKSGDPINRIGYQRTIVIALCICAGGCALFSPAAAAGSYAFFLGALFLLATGVTLLQIAANPYAAILGKPENASSRLNLAQGLNSLGTTLAPIAGGLLVYKVFASEGELALDALKTPYLIFAGVCLVLAGVVWFIHLPSIGGDSVQDEKSSALGFPQLRLGMAAIFLYVGSEVAIGSYLIDFMGNENVMGWAKPLATTYLAFYWGGAMIGRLCGSIAMCDMENPGRKPVYMIATAAAVMALIYIVTAVDFKDGELVTKFIELKTLWPFAAMVGLCLVAFAIGKGRPAMVLSVFSVFLIALLIVAALTTGKVALWAALGAGLFNSIMWSNIFTLAIEGLKEHTSQGSSLLVMMIVGGALFPLVMGAAADRFGIRHAFLVPVLSYVYIAFYGWWCHARSAKLS
ncbi:sugar MFS transporter [Adhaeretor mobilis]|uniref:L-fucose-proton symporter n=1 Tax=Adhaeretor mobilis TaxID=1930276 RepID=A0A517N191_9BACT|nr:sugar MFS transporter [Adhaeretor mobilis]QDT00902.1 L-fucose-proton symporter [Adhaeretor mobilis]